MEVFSVQLPDLPIPSIKCELTFAPYYKYIKEQVSDSKSSIYNTFLRSILSLLDASPELLQPIKDIQILEQHKELLELLRITHNSQVEGDNKLHSLGMPGGTHQTMNYFSASEEFKRFFTEKAGYIKLLSIDSDTESLYRDSYTEILERCYGIQIKDSQAPQTILQFVDDSTSVKRYYRAIRRNNFADILACNKQPELRQEWVDYAIGAIGSINDLEKPIEFDQFKVRGFFLLSIIEDTEQVALQELRDTVAKMHTYDVSDAIPAIKNASLSLLGNDNLDIGFLPFMKVNDRYVYHDIYAKISLVFSRLRKHMSQEELAETFEFVTNMSDQMPNIVSSVNSDVFCLEPDCVKDERIRKILVDENLKTLVFVPIRYQDRLLGVIELGSIFENQVDSRILKKIERASLYYRELFYYKISALEEMVKDFIMQRYTSIQSSVLWKFNEEAWNAIKELKSEQQKITKVTPTIRFDNLYPFYGAIDYRNSSVKQLQAIQSDYLLQLDYLKTILQDDILLEDPTINEFVRLIEAWEERIDADLDVEEEYELRHFLEDNALSFLGQLHEKGILDNDVYKAYVADARSKTGTFHLSHNDYEASLQSLNTLLKQELNKSQNNLIQVVPHYFEKFQTDGLEFSIYAGKSIEPNKVFPSNAVDIIAAWQIDTMLKMAKSADRYKGRLSIPLETTQLILIHENMVDISYRIDEKHFDVEGSYSIRYEVVKKRIDKVRLFNSNERLTQPGTIAIAYAHISSCKPYIDRIYDLIEEGELMPDIEYLDLEQLKGVGKLKAIRVKINYANSTWPQIEKEATINS